VNLYKYDYMTGWESNCNIRSPPITIVLLTYYFHSRTVQNIKAEM